MKYDDNVEQRYGIKLVSDRVVRKEAQFSTRESFEWLRKLVLHLIASPNPMVVPIYRFEVMEEAASRTNGYGTYRYAYEMMRLPMLTEEEKDIISMMIRARRPVYGPESNEPRSDIPGQKDYPALVQFMNQVLDERNYTDLHDNNFLKDEDGNYRIIDLEGFARYPGLGERR